MTTCFPTATPTSDRQSPTTQVTHGTTDDLGFNVARDPIHVPDLNATLLCLPGFDHPKLTYRFPGRDFRLTNAHGEFADALLA